MSEIDHKQPTVQDRETRIVAFHSFKGGTGRSLAVANVGYLLASRGRDVLLVDADLESPGLTTFLCPRIQPHNGFIDYLLDLRESLKKSGFGAKVNIRPYSVNPYKLNRDLTSGDQLSGSLRLMPSNADRSFVHKVHNLQVDDAYRLGVGVGFFKLLADRFRDSDYDYVLLDTSNGFNSLSGALVNDTADHLVELCGLNRQSIEGASRYLKITNFLGVQKRNKLTIVASSVPREEIEMRKRRIKLLKRRFGQDPIISLTYHPRLALIEDLFAFSYPNDMLAYGYRDLAEYLLRLP